MATLSEWNPWNNEPLFAAEAIAGGVRHFSHRQQLRRSAKVSPSRHNTGSAGLPLAARMAYDAATQQSPTKTS
jgi:transposase